MAWKIQGIFENAKGLTIEQLSKAKTLFNVRGLGLVLTEEVKEKCTHFLEKPEEVEPKQDE